jgi:hypothetical protein
VNYLLGPLPCGAAGWLYTWTRVSLPLAAAGWFGCSCLWHGGDGSNCVPRTLPIPLQLVGWVLLTPVLLAGLAILRGLLVGLAHSRSKNQGCCQALCVKD